MQLKLLLGFVPSLLLAQLGGMCTPTCFPAQKIIYADILHGNDSNSGVCQPDKVNAASVSACAVKTLAVAVPKFATQGSGGALGLMRGSCERWREQIKVNAYTLATFTHVLIGGVNGTGANPLLDASDIITGTDACGIVGTGSWTADTGTTWVASVTALVDALGWVNFWVNGAGPTVGGVTRATSQANCEATVNTYWPSSDSGGTFNIYYNNGSAVTNPTTDGKLYEFSSRPTGINDDGAGARYLTLVNVDARRNHTNNGSIDISQYSTSYSVNANEGTKHNMLIADGSSVNGLGMHNAWYGGQGSIMLILFDAFSLSAGISVSNTTVSQDVLDSTVTTYFGHWTGPGYGSNVPVTNLTAINMGNVLDGPWTTATNISCTGCSSGTSAGFSGQVLTNYTFASPASGASAISMPLATTLTLTNAAITCSLLNQGCIVSQTTGASLTMSGTNTCQNLQAGGCIFTTSGIQFAALNISGTTFLQPNVGGSQIYLPIAPASASINHNVYHYASGIGNVNWGGTSYVWNTPANITAWKALGFDANSSWANLTP